MHVHPVHGAEPVLDLIEHTGSLKIGPPRTLLGGAVERHHCRTGTAIRDEQVRDQAMAVVYGMQAARDGGEGEETFDIGIVVGGLG